jgi:Domain of unknown function (DUF4262)
MRCAHCLHSVFRYNPAEMKADLLNPARAESDVDRRMFRNIKEYGVERMLIGGDPDNESPSLKDLYNNPFGYTVGLEYTYGQPEVIVIGLDLDLISSMLNSIHEQVMAGLALQDGMLVDELVGGYSCCLKKVEAHSSKRQLGFACWFYGGTDFRVLQVVWPAAHPETSYPAAVPELAGHVFPWTPGASPDFGQAQPILS